MHTSSGSSYEAVWVDVYLIILGRCGLGEVEEQNLIRTFCIEEHEMPGDIPGYVCMRQLTADKTTVKKKVGRKNIAAALRAVPLPLEGSGGVVAVPERKRQVFG